jgi:hypothetical protein
LAFITGLCLTGHPIQWLALPPDYWPFAAFATEFGIWVHPLNLFGSLFVFAAVLIIQIVKWLRRDPSMGLRLTQILIWWIYCLMFGIAQQLGTYRGP